MITSLSFPKKGAESYRGEDQCSSRAEPLVRKRSLRAGAGEIQYKGISGSFIFGSVFSKPDSLFNSVVLAWDGKGKLEGRALLDRQITLVSKESIEGIPQKIRNNPEYLPSFLEDTYVTLTPLKNAGFKIFVHSRLRGGMPPKSAGVETVPNAGQALQSVTRDKTAIQFLMDFLENKLPLDVFNEVRSDLIQLATEEKRLEEREVSNRQIPSQLGVIELTGIIQRIVNFVQEIKNKLYARFPDTANALSLTSAHYEQKICSFSNEGCLSSSGLNAEEVLNFKKLIEKGDLLLLDRETNRHDAEESYAQALETVAKYNDKPRTLLAIKRLAFLYSQFNRAGREKEDSLMAAGLYNYAHRLSIEEKQRDIEERLIEIELKLLHSMNLAHFNIDVSRYYLLLNRKNLEWLQAKAFQDLPADNTPHAISSFQGRITDQLKDFIKTLINQTFSLMGGINFDYAIIGFGSLARKEATPYSDLEFGILLKEDTEKNREYFRNFTRLLHLKVINLGQTILPALNIPSLQRIRFYDDVIPRGFAFDGAGVQGKGHKTPLGCPGSFELIQTPKAMAQFQGIRDDGKFWIEKEPHLPMELLLFSLIHGNKGLVTDYQDEVSRVLSQSYNGMTMREWMAKHHLVKEDFASFEPSLKSVEKQGQMFLVKHDLYRLAHLLINRLALLESIDALDTFSQIDRLRMRGILTQGAENLKKMVATAQYFRLKTYADFGRQKEYMNPLLCYTDEKKQEMQATLKQLYRCLIPFAQGVKAFFNGTGSSLADNSFLDTSKYTEGMIAARLLNLEEAVNCFNEALHIAVEGMRLPILNMLGLVLYQKGDKSCIEKFRIYLDELRRHPDVLSISLSNFLSGLNNFANAQSRFATLNESLSMYHQAIDLANGYYGRGSPKVAVHYNNRAEIFRQMGNLNEAKKDYEQVISIYSNHQGSEENNPERAIDYSNIGNLYLELNQLSLAEVYFERARKIHEIVYGLYHPIIANDLLNFCSLHIRRGEFSIAQEQANRAKKMASHLHGPKSDIIVQAELKEGAIFMKLMKKDEARVCFEKALQLVTDMFHPTHFLAGECLTSLGQLSAMEKSWEQAIDYYKKASSIFEREGNLNLLGVSKFSLGACHMQLNQPSEAHRLTEEALDLFRRIYKPDHLILGMSFKKKGDLYRQEGRLTEAQNNFLDAISIYLRQNEIPEGLSECYYSSGEVAWEQQNRTLAKQRFCEAIEAATKYYHDGEKLGMWFAKVGTFFFRQGDSAAALPLLEKALEIFYTCSTPSKDIGSAHSTLANTYLQLTPANKEKSVEHFTKAIDLLSPLLEEQHFFIQDIKKGLAKAKALP